jgi:hypothetical protein
VQRPQVSVLWLTSTAWNSLGALGEGCGIPGPCYDASLELIPATSGIEGL